MHLTMAVSLITATLVRNQYALDSEIGSLDRSSEEPKLLGKMPMISEDAAFAI